jgi:hypothetical protein
MSGAAIPLTTVQKRCEASVTLGLAGEHTPTFKHVFTFTSPALQFDAAKLWSTPEEALEKAHAHVEKLDTVAGVEPQAVVWGIALFAVSNRIRFDALRTMQQPHIVTTQHVPHQPKSYTHDTRGVYVVDVIGNTDPQTFFCSVPYDLNMSQGAGPPIAHGYFDDNVFVDFKTEPSRPFLQLRTTSTMP